MFKGAGSEEGRGGGGGGSGASMSGGGGVLRDESVLAEWATAGSGVWVRL